jgi:hypothetical protein
MSLKVGVIIFGSVRFLSKKSYQTKKKLKKKPKPVQTDRVRFGFLGQKLVQIGLARFSSLARFSQFWLGFFLFGSVFAVWARFGFFGFLLIKPKLN